MSKLLLYIAIAFLLYQVARRIMRSLKTPSTQQGIRRGEPGQVPGSRPSPPAEIDYSKIRDADYRDIP